MVHVQRLRPPPIVGQDGEDQWPMQMHSYLFSGATQSLILSGPCPLLIQVAVADLALNGEAALAGGRTQFWFFTSAHICSQWSLDLHRIVVRLATVYSICHWYRQWHGFHPTSGTVGRTVASCTVARAFFKKDPFLHLSPYLHHLLRHLGSCIIQDMC